MEISPVEPDTVYYGSQYLHRTRDGGLTWETISPDLTAHPKGTQYGAGEPITRDATGEEVYSTLYAIRESAVKPGVIWTGSNDGLVFVSEDAGKSWTNVTPKGLPAGGRVQNIEPGVRNAGTAYVAIYRYLLGDFAPYLYRTDDYGKSWTRIADGRNGIAPDEPTRVVREDPERPGLLYAGTEFGLYVSFDRGDHWQSFQLNLPAVPVTDIRLANGDLVMSTQGRGFWILDNLASLRQLPQPSEARETRLYRPAVATRLPASGDHGQAPGNGPEYPLAGAQIDYFVGAERPGRPLALTILDKAGTPIRTFTSAAVTARGGGRGDDDEGNYRPVYPASLDATPGMHRFVWDLRYAGAPVPVRPGIVARGRFPEGPVAAPGDYTIVLTAGASTMRQALHVVEDPRVLASGVTDADLSGQLAHNLKVLALVNDTNLAVARVNAAMAAEKNPERARALKAIADRLITPRIRYSQPALQTHVTYLYSETNATDQKIGRDAAERYVELRRRVDAVIADLDKLIGPPTAADLERGQATPDEDDDNDSET